MEPHRVRFAFIGRLIVGALLGGILVMAQPVLVAAVPEAVQPKPGTVYSGAAANGGRVTLVLKQVWDSTNERTYLAPLITWTKVRATCDIFDGTTFVPTPKRITARLQVLTWAGRVHNGRFSETLTYSGTTPWTFKGTFSRNSVTGTVHKMTSYGTDSALGYGCSWGPLTFDLAAN
jgi:hypothetical protein